MGNSADVVVEYEVAYFPAGTDEETALYKLEYVRTVPHNPDRDESTFKYQLTNIAGPSQTHLFLELPSECGASPSSWSPANGTSTTENVGFTALKWTMNTSSTSDPLVFAVTYAGREYEGSAVRVAVKGGPTYYGTGDADVITLPGACKGDFTVSGKVSVEGGGSGVPGVEVFFENTSDLSVTSATSGSGGLYAVELDPGEYRPYVEAAFIASGLSVFEGGPDHTLDIGVAPDPDFLVPKIQNQEEGYQSTAVTYAPDQWLKIFRQRNSGNATYSEADLLTILEKVEEIEPTGPGFVFDFGADPIKTAIAELHLTPKNKVESLRQELLALELNHVVNQGLLDTDLQSAIIEALERELAASAQKSAGKQEGSFGAAATTASSFELAYTINRSGGGSGGVGKR